MTTRIIEEQVVPGKRLGRHVEHRSESHRYAFKAPAQVPIQSVRWTRHAPIFDQGNTGSCTGNACLGALGTGPLYDALSAHAELPPLTEQEAVTLYSAATRLDDVPGQYPPDDTGSSGLAVAKAAEQAGYLSGYQHAFSYQDALAALMTGPVIVGVDWYSGFDDPQPDGGMPLKGNLRGGHELVVDEYDATNDRWWITNSWGSWGLDGRAYWTGATVQKLLASDGDCTILIPVTAPAPTPTPTPTPVPPPQPDSPDAPFLAAAGLVPTLDTHLARARVRHPELNTATPERDSLLWAAARYFGVHWSPPTG